MRQILDNAQAHGISLLLTLLGVTPALFITQLKPLYVLKLLVGLKILVSVLMSARAGS